jgi:hypothetical protein
VIEAIGNHDNFNCQLTVFGKTENNKNGFLKIRTCLQLPAMFMPQAGFAGEK